MNADKKKPVISTPHPVDVHVGSKIRQRRTMLGVSQEKLAESLDLTFQQIQKYETGRNRVSASRLYQIGAILDTEISHFFEGYNDNFKKSNGLSESGQAGYAAKKDIMNEKETLDLIKVYYSIHDEKIRKDFVKMMKQVSKHVADDDTK
jgi:transcriptional regulator with XRE-family HTH domain|tara:strand:- start:730 stop:1176 length:447 start_codon:yes stop_codon:yes gene_type:complete